MVRMSLRRKSQLKKEGALIPRSTASIIASKFFPTISEGEIIIYPQKSSSPSFHPPHPNSNCPKVASKSSLTNFEGGLKK